MTVGPASEKFRRFCRTSPPSANLSVFGSATAQSACCPGLGPKKPS